MSSSKVEIQSFKIPFEAIKLGTENFSAANYIGGGGFGKVYKGKLPDSRWLGTVAVKQLNPDGWQGNHEFRNEVSMLYTYRHKNIVTLVGFCDEGKEMIIVYEYAINGSLDKHLSDRDKMSLITWEQRLKICIGAAEGLDHLHSGLGEHHRVIHRDVKSSNILLDENMEAKISDFGLSKFSPKNQPYTHLNTRIAGTSGYCDPHYYRTNILTKESDVYSFGVILFEMLSGRLVFPKNKCPNGGGGDDDDDSQNLMALVDRYKDKLERIIDPNIRDQINLESFHVFKEIASQCLEMDYRKRPEMAIVVTMLNKALDCQVSMLFAKWNRICELPGVNDAACAHYVVTLQQNGFLKGDDTSDRFFRHLLELAVAHCLSSEVINSSPPQSHQQAHPLSFLAIDTYAALVVSIMKFCPVDQGSSKLPLFSKVLAVTVRFIQKDAEEKKASFNPRPYFRLFINWLLDLSTLEPVFDGANFQVLTALATSFHALQPLKVPAFSFAWLELVSHRSFMPKLLSGNAQKGWPHFQRLLVDLFQFMEPFLRNDELAEPVHFLYKGTLRVLLVLLHDFPEFLCDFHFSFCDVIPPSCIQMRNIVLCAFPRNMRLPDPSSHNLKIDMLPEISQSPRILSEVDAALKDKKMKNDVDEYLKMQTRPQRTSFLSELKQKLLLSPSEAARSGTRYNVPLMNSLVLYVGMQAVQQSQARAPHAQSMASSVPLAVFVVGAAFDIFQTLLLELETEGRYLFLNAVANQLRYPSNHTHYFSFILLYLFSESKQEVIQEQITRVLLERLIVDRPHPWGLLITFVELVKNPRYNFWNKTFTRCAPDIEKLFESVSRACGGPKPVEDNVVAGGISDNMH